MDSPALNSFKHDKISFKHDKISVVKVTVSFPVDQAFLGHPVLHLKSSVSCQFYMILMLLDCCCLFTLNLSQKLISIKIMIKHSDENSLQILISKLITIEQCNETLMPFRLQMPDNASIQRQTEAFITALQVSIADAK